jgi:hypothetical protein
MELPISPLLGRFHFFTYVHPTCHPTAIAIATITIIIVITILIGSSSIIVPCQLTLYHVFSICTFYHFAHLSILAPYNCRCSCLV